MFVQPDPTTRTATSFWETATAHYPLTGSSDKYLSKLFLRLVSSRFIFLASTLLVNFCCLRSLSLCERAADSSSF